MEKNRSNLGIFLEIFTLIITSSIFLKGIIDVDPSFDTWGYHLPFAARLWNIVPAEQYINMESRFAGFPLLGEWLQGLLWFVTGHLQTANLVGLLSILLYAYFLKVYWQTPIYLSILSLLAIPLVLIHATSCYVDLPGNIGLAILIMMNYKIFLQQKFPSRSQLIIIILSATFASNIKTQLEPLVFVALCPIIWRIFWLHWQNNPVNAKQSRVKWFIKAIIIIVISLLLIFATPIKNIALYGNPFYPVRVEIAGKVLNHQLPLYNQSPGYLSQSPKAQRWLYSILEIKAAPWSIDQWSKDINRSRMGGFFGAYMVFNLLLLGYLIIGYRNRDTITAAVVTIVMSLVAANFPQSHELRYFIYWAIVLVSINMILVTKFSAYNPQSKFIQPAYLALISLVFFSIVVVKTNFIFIKPNFNTLEKYKTSRIDTSLIAKLQPNDRVCLVGKYPDTFLYTPWFNRQLGYTYSIQMGGRAKQCQEDRRILP
jgi:hypothetical protein